ncbi:MAG: hypothetical protein CMM46_12440 [Rhodospirillaceae bacterium]|nr:hypothetical protein [Rhodospirillaceae bacterium]
MLGDDCLGIVDCRVTEKFGHDLLKVGTFSRPALEALAAFADTLSTCRELDVPDALPKLLHDLVKRGVDAGLSDQQITALTKVLRG